MTTESITIDSIVQGIRDSTYDINTESRLARVGLKDGQDIAGLLEKYDWLFNLDTVRQAEAAYRQEADADRKDRLRRVYYYLLDGYVERQTAATEDRIVSFEMEATIEVDGAQIPYHNVRAALSQEPDYEKRERLWDASLHVVEETNPDRLAIVRDRLATLSKDFGYNSYTDYNSEKKRVDYALLRSRLEGFLAQTEATYLDHMDGWVEQTTGRRLGEVGSHHLAFISRLPQYDPFFGKERLTDVYQRTLMGMGFDPAQQRNILLDTEDRPKKNPRACCYAPDPPGEVHLIIKPLGGLDDYAAFFHEAGHAQHFGNEDPSLDYIYRSVSASHALTEIYSFLMEFLIVNRAWLQEVVGLPEQTAREVIYYTRLGELRMLRRYIAKLQYELEFYEDPLNEHRNQELYAGKLIEATRFAYSPVPYLDDMDEGYYSADYLRAWITEAMLRHHLEERYSESWFASRDAGEFLRGLWATGEKLENEEVAEMIGCEPFDTSFLARQFEGLTEMRP